RWLADLTPQAISQIVAGFDARTSPHSFFVLQNFRGPGARVAPDATPFGERRNHFMVEIGAAWEPSSKTEAVRHRKWAADLSSKIAQSALPGGYANFLTLGSSQIDAAYGNNGQRLRTLKRAYDPDNVFSSAIPLPN